jgi:hypothetical protein
MHNFIETANPVVVGLSMLAACVIAGGVLWLLTCALAPDTKPGKSERSNGTPGGSDADANAVAQATAIATVAVVASTTTLV